MSNIPVLVAFQLLVILHAVLAAPTQNLTQLRTETAPSWVADADNRGTWNLLYSCVFTLALCVWTAIHLNVPAAGESRHRQLFRKAQWVIAAIFAPELAVYTAWQQWSWARQIRDELQASMATANKKVVNGSATTERGYEDQRHSPSSQPSESTREGTKDKPMPNPFTHQAKILSHTSVSLTYGFYVVMGGLVVDVSDMHDKLSRLTLTPTGVLHLARLGLFEHISDNDIGDKSKADWLAKGLVILQVTWMILQCISRRAAGYPLSPLEVHTLVHAGCALLMYTLWFKKPLDVKEPTVINIAGFEEPLALMLLQSPEFGWIQYGNIAIPENFMRVRLDRTDLRHWPNRLSSEASYLMFGQKYCEAEDNSLAHSTEVDNIGSVDNDSPTSRPSTNLERRSNFLKSHINQGVLQVSNIQQQNVDTLGSLEEQATLTWSSSAGSNIACNLTTGDLLAKGIGPNGFPLQPSDKSRPSLSRYEGLFSRRKSITPARNISLVDANLRKKLPSSHIWHDHNKSFYKISMSLSPKDVLRWNLAAAEFERLRSADNTLRLFSDYLPVDVNIDARNHITNYLTLRSPNLDVEAWSSDWYFERNPPTAATVMIFCLLFLLGILYGGVHLSLWNYDFATPAEMMLWRISGITLVAVPSILVIILFTAGSGSAVHTSWKTRSARRPKTRESKRTAFYREARAHFHLKRFCSVVETLIGALIFLATAVLLLALAVAAICSALLFIFARVFIVVESFISLRHVPLGVYVNVGWAKYIPHL